MSRNQSLAKTITEAIAARGDRSQWEEFIMSILKRLSLSPEECRRATAEYETLARQIAQKLGVHAEDVHIVVQGSMKTETTISASGNRKFDLDIVVKLTGDRFQRIQSEEFFRAFGAALKEPAGNVGTPEPKRRCWRLPYPGRPFYFDVTPALPGSLEITGTDLRVRDPETGWSPSNPEEFANWFCETAELRFAFQDVELRKMIEAKTQIDPMPDQVVAIDDILRRFVQIIKLHRDNFYRGASEDAKIAMPISVILVTLAARAYQTVWANYKGTAASAIEVVFEMLELMPSFIENRGDYRVENPKLERENFADRWNKDNGRRAAEFKRWHQRAVEDLRLLFMENYRSRSEARIRGVFGEAGVQAWKDISETPAVLQGLVASQAGRAAGNPQRPVPIGSRNTLA